MCNVQLEWKQYASCKTITVPSILFHLSTITTSITKIYPIIEQIHFVGFNIQCTNSRPIEIVTVEYVGYSELLTADKADATI